MPTITCQKCVDKAEIILEDITNARFLAADLTGWFNDGQRAVVGYKPDAYVKEEAVTLVAGVNQGIPATGMGLIGISHNMGAGGETPGSIIRLIDKNLLSAQRPAWPTDMASATVQYYMFDDRMPRVFQVYPQQPASGFGSVWMTYTDTPADILIGATMLIDDIYAIPIQHYIVAMALSNQPKYEQVSAAHMGIFRAMLGVKEDAEIGADPNRRARE